MAKTLGFTQVSKLGNALKAKLGTYINDRQAVEKQWLINLRQYLGQYDKDVLDRIPPERSHVYPMDTAVKVDGEVSIMMEMMFPAQDKNWDLTVSPTPSIQKDDLDSIIGVLTQQNLAKAAEEERQPTPVTSDQIERGVQQFAKVRKDRMETEIEDQLADKQVDYPNLCKRVLRSGAIYGIGVARSPQVRTQTERDWERKGGEWKAVKNQVSRPYPEYARIWDVYPDLSARVWDEQEGLFERYLFNRHDFKELTKRPDFQKGLINQYLKDHTSGNYTPSSFAKSLQEIAEENTDAAKPTRRYEVYRWFGFQSAHELQAAGVPISEDKMSTDILADVWIIDSVVIKAEVAAFGDRPTDIYHGYIPSEDEDAGLTGRGLPERVRDSQMRICASSRAEMDNMAATAGPVYEVNEDLLPPDRKAIGAIHSFMIIKREGEGESARAPAVRAIFTPSHIAEIQSITKAAREQMDIESGIPAWTLGSPQDLGDAFRTTTNMSSMRGGATMGHKDKVRSFDKFTASLIGSMLAWNMEFNPKDDIKGDFQARAKGSISLVAKEVRGIALDQFITTLTPEERAMLDTYGLLVDRLTARDLPSDRLLPRKEALQKVAEMQEAARQANQIESENTQAKTGKTLAETDEIKVDTEVAKMTAPEMIKEMQSRVAASLAQAKNSSDIVQLKNLELILGTALEGGVKE